MNDIFITGLGHHSSLGAGVPNLEIAISSRQKVQTESHVVAGFKGDQTLKVFVAPDVELPTDLPEAVQRRMPRISKMFFAAASEAIEHARQSHPSLLKTSPERVGMVIGTAFGPMNQGMDFQYRIIHQGAAGSSPTLFAASIQNAIASHLSILFGIQGPTSTVMNMQQTFVGAIGLAQQWLAQDMVDHVIVAVGDEIARYHLYMMTDEKVGPLPLGEGAAAFVLSREPGAKPLGRLTDLRLSGEKNIATDRTYFNNWRSEGESPKLRSHAHLYGRFLTGSAIEALIACGQISQDKIPTSIFEEGPGGSSQSFCLRGNHA